MVEQIMTMMVLLGVYEVRGFFWIPTCGITLKSKSDKVAEGGRYKDLIQVLLVVAALVATVTFAAGFTILGGFNSSAPKSGMAILVDDQNLTIFLTFDAMAMYGSIITIGSLIWAQLAQQELAQRACHMALTSLWFALLFMYVAFYFGVDATIRHNSMLAIMLTFLFVVFLIVFTYITSITFGFLCCSIPTHSLALILKFVNEDMIKKTIK